MITGWLNPRENQKGKLVATLENGKFLHKTLCWGVRGGGKAEEEREKREKEAKEERKEENEENGGAVWGETFL